MPPLPVIANVIACHVRGTLPNGRQWVNGYHVLKPGGMSIATAIATIDPLLVALYNTAHAGGGISLLSVMSTGLHMSDISYLPLDGSSATSTVSHALAGGEATDQLANSTAITVTSQTGLRGRDKRGRVFLPPICENQNFPGGVPNPALITGWQINFNGYLADATTATIFPVVASYKHATQNLITKYVVRAVYSSRRKRVPRPV